MSPSPEITIVVIGRPRRRISPSTPRPSFIGSLRSSSRMCGSKLPINSTARWPSSAASTLKPHEAISSTHACRVLGWSSATSTRLASATAGNALELNNQAQGIADDPERQQDYRYDGVRRRAKDAIGFPRLGCGDGRSGCRNLAVPGVRTAAIARYRSAVGLGHAGYHGGCYIAQTSPANTTAQDVTAAGIELQGASSSILVNRPLRTPLRQPAR